MANTVAKRLTFGQLPPALALVLIFGLTLSAFAQSQPAVDLSGKNVLILHGFETSSPLTLEINRGLLDALSGGGMPRENLFIESLDFRRNPGPEFRKLLAEQMRLEWSHRKADMIITAYPEAWNLR